MANVTQATLLTRLKTMLRDPSDKTFTLAEKNEALKQAIDDDPFVFTIERDDSTTIVAGTNNYDLASNFQELTQLLVDIRSDGFPIPMSPSGYRVINGSIWIERDHRNLPDGKKLIQVGKHKLHTTDSIPDYLAGYIIHTAAAYLLELLLSDKTGRFLKNDTSMAEIMAAINNHRGVAARYQRTLPNHNTVVL